MDDVELDSRDRWLVAKLVPERWFWKNVAEW